MDHSQVWGWLEGFLTGCVSMMERLAEAGVEPKDQLSSGLADNVKRLQRLQSWEKSHRDGRPEPLRLDQ